MKTILQKLTALALVIVFLLPSSAFAVVTYDTSAGGAGGSGVSQAFTVANQAHRVLILALAYGSILPATPTYGGVSFTEIDRRYTATGEGRAILYYINNPLTGSNTLAINAFGGGWGMYSFYDAMLADPIESTTQQTGQETNFSMTQTPSADNSMLVDVVAIRQAGTTWSNLVNMNNTYEAVSGADAANIDMISGRSNLIVTAAATTQSGTSDTNGYKAGVQTIVETYVATPSSGGAMLAGSMSF